MENAVEALKIAFAVLLFVMALTLSISSFSQATSAVHAITSLRDRESQYTYVKPSKDLSRIVGLETVVSSVYKSHEENTEIHFFKSDEETPMALYYDADANGDVKKDSYNQKIEMSYLDLSTGFGKKQLAMEFLDILFGGITSVSSDLNDKYKDRIIHAEGLYKKFSNAQFEERLGEYYQGTSSTKTKKRVITYILQP